MRKIYFPLKQESFVRAKDGLLSFAFVREPFERLASAYWDKMDRNWTNWENVYDTIEMRDKIIRKYVFEVFFLKKGKIIYAQLLNPFFV